MVFKQPAMISSGHGCAGTVQRRAVLGGLAAGLAGLSGCASPNPQLFTLATVPPARVYQGDWLVELRRVGLPAYLDRPEIVRSSDGYRVFLASNQRWAEPLTDMVDRILRQDLSLRLPGSTVFSESGAISADPTVIVEADLQRFESPGDGSVLLLAQFAIRSSRSHTALMAQPVRISHATAGGGSATETASLVAALSAALAEMADAMAAAVARTAPDVPRLDG
ncbi:PqiC family protein [Granulibacter bethesdensis]|uniref:PqiC family protein n=1 Tax=Granulibacter bethesdensis TaxID=364410 RepID=UPI00046CFC39|nr:PqiC family protein [Granulibacter bethesdensis]